MHLIRQTALAALIFTVACCAGCVRRTILITSSPDGALVWVNDREVGRTPVEIDFVHYGEYDVRLVRDGYEPLLTSGTAKPPLWDAPGPDFFAELTPGEQRVQIEWHYDLEPVEDDREALIERARKFSERVSLGEDSGK